jgi:hypothetical protein
LEEIGFNAFCSCKSLITELSFPHSLKKIGQQAFYESAIKGNLVLPDGLEYIGGAAFRDCISLTGSLTIPKGVKVVESLAFFCCSGFNGNLTLQMGLTEIQWEAFGNTNFKGELNIP